MQPSRQSTAHRPSSVSTPPTSPPSLRATASRIGSSAKPPASIIIPPPPEAEHPSEQAIEEAIHAWTLRHGFNVTKKQVELNKHNDVCYRLFACDHWGKPKNTRRLQDKDRVRERSSSIRTGCRMRIRIVAVDRNNASGPWKILYTRDGSHNHNHEPSLDVRVHVPHRQRAAKLVQQVSPQAINELIFVHAAAGISTAKTYATLLHQDEDTLVIPKDISNRKANQNEKLKTSESAISALFEELKKHHFYFYYETEDTSNRLRYLLWAHPDTLALAHDRLDLLVLDCTYKTNLYDCPLLNIITVTGMNTILPIAQCWLPGESKSDYCWALSTMKKLLVENGIKLPRLLLTDRDLACMKATDLVFPSASKLLCRWHANRSVEARVRKILGEVKLPQPDFFGRTKVNTCRTNAFLDEYYAALQANTEEEFEACRVVLRRMNASLADYLDTTWWKYKVKLVKFWTDQNLHFGCLDTSTVEGTHAKIKSWPESSKCNLLTAFTKLLPWWKSSAKSVSLATQRNLSKVPFNLSDPTYSNVVKVITHHALHETHCLRKQAVKIVHDYIKDPQKKSEIKPCTGTFRRSHGRPCVHEMIRIYESDFRVTLSPADFDEHWWVQGEPQESTSEIMEFAVNKRKRSSNRKPHQAGFGVYSNRRDPSAFEVLPEPRPHEASDGSFVELLANDPTELIDSVVQDAHLPPRAWGYAGLH